MYPESTSASLFAVPWTVVAANQVAWLSESGRGTEAPPEVEPPAGFQGKKIVLVAGSKSHGPGDHEFFAGTAILMNLLKQTPGVWPVMVRNGWPKDESVFDITLERAVALLKEPKQFSARGALKVLGKHPDDNQPVAWYSGRYGAYVKHGKVNATLPDQGAIGTIKLEDAIQLLAAKSGKKPRAKPKSTKAGKPKMKRAA